MGWMRGDNPRCIEAQHHMVASCVHCISLTRGHVEARLATRVLAVCRHDGSVCCGEVFARCEVARRCVPAHVRLC